jgi:protein-S-isoprenylcysteine O-methyltransferase Ste14
MRWAKFIPVVIAGIAGGVIGVRIAQHGLNLDLTDSWSLVLGVALFVVLSIYWGIAARGEAPERGSEAPLSRIIHQVLVNASLLLIVLPVPGLLTRVLPHSNVIVACGFVIELCGLWIAIAARRELGRNWSAQVRIAEDHALVRTGPYRYLRHPIYTGALCMYAGLAMISGTLHAVLGLVLVCLAYWRKIGLEERILEQHFGPEFKDYRRHSWAVIPRVL